MVCIRLYPPLLSKLPYPIGCERCPTKWSLRVHSMGSMVSQFDEIDAAVIGEGFTAR